tara:strand:- start:45 stop:536 length:492 start_codon:yes stop_codon:yes gene_type:complete
MSKKPVRIFFDCKVCKKRRFTYQKRLKHTTWPFCDSYCKKHFYRTHPFSVKPNSYNKSFNFARFKIWLHNQISVFTPQFVSIRQDHSFRKLVRDEMWGMRHELNLTDAIYFIVFMFHKHGIVFLKDRELYTKIYGSFIAQTILQEIDWLVIDSREKAVKMLEE